MAEADVTELIKRLTSHSDSLARNIARAQAAFDTIQGSYANLKRVWGGAAAEDFYSQWERSMEGIERWLEGARQIKMLLDERLNTLRAADRPFDGGSAGSGVATNSQQLGIRFPLPANEERDLDTAMGFLRAERRRDNVPLRSEEVPGKRGFTVARLDIGGESLVGKSYGKTKSDIADPPPGVDMYQVMRHAEAHAITQAKRKGITAKTATLYVDRDPCRACRAALPHLARWMGVDKLRAFTPDGLFGEY